ncbi:MAG: UDP-N-acetylmuramate dehydrogenase [Patescibacteria group bacterium]
MFKPEVSLTKYSNYKIGGLARQFCHAKKVDELAAAIQKARKEKLPVFILGGGTNLLINDEGFNGLVLKPELSVLKANGNLVKVGAGVSMSELLDYLIAKSLSGLEWAGGLPGTVGGAIRGNAGAFGGEIKDNVQEVVSLDISGKTPKVVKRSNAECKFGYRNSIFKMRDGTEVILEAVLSLGKVPDKKAIRQAIEEKIKYRKERHPMEYPNIGSIFKNVDLKNVPKKVQAQFAAKIKNDPFPVLPTAVLIAETGLKGVSFGGAMISPKHPNFIVNVLNAKADDVKQLIGLVKSRVKNQFGIKLEEEIIYV